jgi:hypothetical protein
MKRVVVPRGHHWARGRGTQTHLDRRHKRKRTRQARRREALEQGLE